MSRYSPFRPPLLVVVIAGHVLAACPTSQCLRVPVSARVAQQAVNTCKSALATDLGRRDVFHRYAEILRVRGNFAQLEATSRKVIAHNNARTDARYYLAYALRKQGRFSEALAAYKAYVSGNSDNDAYYGIALCYEGLRDRAGAVSAYQAYTQRETRLGRRSWVDKAKARITALQGGAPLLDVGPARPGAVAAATPRPQAAARPKPRATPPSATTPTPTPTPPIAAATPRPTPRPAPTPAPVPRAAPAPTDCSAFEKSISANPFAVDAYEKFALCASKAGRHADVVKRMRIAVRDNPDFSRGWLHLGNAQKALGQAAVAKSSYGKACKAGVTEACSQ